MPPKRKRGPLSGEPLVSVLVGCGLGDYWLLLLLRRGGCCDGRLDLRGGGGRDGRCGLGRVVANLLRLGSESVVELSCEDGITELRDQGRQLVARSDRDSGLVALEGDDGEAALDGHHGTSARGLLPPGAHGLASLDLLPFGTFSGPVH